MQICPLRLHEFARREHPTSSSSDARWSSWSVPIETYSNTKVCNKLAVAFDWLLDRLELSKWPKILKSSYHPSVNLSGMPGPGRVPVMPENTDLDCMDSRRDLSHESSWISKNKKPHPSGCLVKCSIHVVTRRHHLNRTSTRACSLIWLMARLRLILKEIASSSAVGRKPTIHCANFIKIRL